MRPGSPFLRQIHRQATNRDFLRSLAPRTTSRRRVTYRRREEVEEVATSPELGPGSSAHVRHRRAALPVRRQARHPRGALHPQAGLRPAARSSAAPFPHGCCLPPPIHRSCSSPCDGQPSASRRRGAVPPCLRRHGLPAPDTGPPHHPHHPCSPCRKPHARVLRARASKADPSRRSSERCRAVRFETPCPLPFTASASKRRA